MADRDGFGRDGLDRLGERLDQSGRMTAAFEAELSRLGQAMGQTGREVSSLTSGFGGGLRRAFEGVVFDGVKLSDALKGVARNMADTVFAVAMRPVQQAFAGALAQGVGGMLGGALPFADGGAFSQGRVMPFAKGGVVSQPTFFPMRGATGLMGEAGPEAIMPLRRGTDGRLGVAAAGGSRPVNVTFNVTTPDVAGFQRSQSQIAARLGRVIARGERNG
ncbi:phage tail tape measure protein [Paracoccus chinensis]|uniref:Phage tail tape measure protein, lambda family n=1 Tax=Paracoccus chinensis TaxID=525640 RepID=A0A1G9GJV5_9RHOB|nr:phage tail tape measure protein [Paracoccus chinensis]SDL00951.1 phage tail tape measure protein, lambda family [Paracoccus chinensis]